MTGSRSNGQLLIDQITCSEQRANGSCAYVTSDEMYYAELDNSSAWWYGEFLSADACCEQCAKQQPRCRFFHLADGICYLGSAIPRVQLRLPGINPSWSSSWMNTAAARGIACPGGAGIGVPLCECTDGLVNCSHRQLEQVRPHSTEHTWQLPRARACPSAALGLNMPRGS